MFLSDIHASVPKFYFIYSVQFSRDVPKYSMCRNERMAKPANFPSVSFFCWCWLTHTAHKLVIRETTSQQWSNMAKFVFDRFPFLSSSNDGIECRVMDGKCENNVHIQIGPSSRVTRGPIKSIRPCDVNRHCSEHIFHLTNGPTGMNIVFLLFVCVNFTLEINDVDRRMLCIGRWQCSVFLSLAGSRLYLLLMLWRYASE